VEPGTSVKPVGRVVATWAPLTVGVGDQLVPPSAEYTGVIDGAAAAGDAGAKKGAATTNSTSTDRCAA
jgi:hypothetical protein